MKLATYSIDATPRLGVVHRDRVVPIEKLLPDAPSEMQALISQWHQLRDRIETIADDSIGLPLASVRLHAPILRPGKILAIGLNYADHIQESGLATPEHQVWFSKQATCINGPCDAVEIPEVSDQIDYEVELVAVIGKRGRHISRADAASHVFGFMVGNDVSVRDWQWRTPQWMLGKSFDTHAPIGPWIVTADEIGNPHELSIRSFVNNEVRQQSNTRHLLFDVWAQIEHLSHAMTLEPGDLLFTGTPGGVGFGFKPPRPLIEGDLVRCEIERIGVIENRMVRETMLQMPV